MLTYQISLIIALLPSLNMQKWGKMSRFLHYFPTQQANLVKDMAMSTMKQYILCPLSSYCPTPGLVLSKPWPCIVRV